MTGYATCQHGISHNIGRPSARPGAARAVKSLPAAIDSRGYASSRTCQLARIDGRGYAEGAAGTIAGRIYAAGPGIIDGTIYVRGVP